MSEAFNEEQFRDVFTVTQKIKTKLQPFIAQYKQQNMTWIMRSFEQIHRMFFDNKMDLLFRFNSIFGIKFLFDTGDVILINLIEIYFLPRVLQIASYDLEGPDDKRGITYFLTHGFPPQTPNVQKFGYNYVRMASQFIFNAAIVKPNRLFENQAYNQPSDYALALKKLQDGGWKMYSAPAYYKEGAAEGIKALFQKSLQEVEEASDAYINYFSQVFSKILVEQRSNPGRLDPRKILEFGDSYITSGVINLCVDFLRKGSLRYKKNSLSLLNYLIKWGDIQAAYEVNCTDILDELLYEVANGESSRTLNRGASLFKGSKASNQQKQELYNQLLKDLQFWALCYPNAIKVKNRQSKIKLVYDEFKNKLQLEFPMNKDLKQEKALFDQQFKKNRIRNGYLLKDLQGKDCQPQSYIRKKEAEIQEPTPEGNSFEQLLKEIAGVDKLLNTVCENQKQVDTKINRILGFQASFQPKLQSADVSEEELSQVLLKWDDLVNKIGKVAPHLEKYKAKKITFQQLNELLLNKKSSPKKQGQPKQQQKPQPIVNSKAIKQEELKKPSQPKIKQQSLPTSSKQVKQEQIPKQVIKSKIPESTKQISKEISKEPSSLPTILRATEQEQKLQKAQTLNKQPVFVSQPPKKLAEPSIKVAVQQMTPIKTMVQSPIKQRDDNGISVLPSVSKQSIEKDPHQSSFKSGTIPKQKIAGGEGIDIKPASHTIIKEESQKVSQALFKEQQSIKKMEHSLKEYERQSERVVEVKKASKIQQLDINELTNKQLFQETQHYEGIRIPKSLKNVTGSYKNEYGSGSVKHLNQPQQNLMHQSRASSRKSSKIKFEESKISVELNQEDQDDLIMTPDNNPLQISYHELSGVEDFIKETKTLSFKKCFEDDKYLFGAERNSKKFWLANETVSLIKPAGARKHSRTKDSTVSIPEILNQRNKKYQEQLKYVQEKKDRKINELQSKIKQLENNGKALTDKLYEQEKQIKQIKASSQFGSRVKKTSILQDQDHVFKAKMATFQNNKSVKDKSFYDDSSRKEPKYLDPLGKIINIRKYAAYFQPFQSEKQRKNLLKNKELLLKNQEIEFGCMTKREKQSLIITFYITPSNDLEGLFTTVTQNDNLDILIQPKSIPSIRKGKQEKVIVTVSIKQLPYTLPKIQFSYNIGSKLDNQVFLVPCSFHKFIYLNPVNQKEMSRRFQKKDKILRGQQVPYSKKLLKSLDSLSDYFPNGALLNFGYPNDNGQVQYGGRAEWEGQQFWVRLMVKQSQFLYVQTVAEENGSLQQFYLSLVTNLLMKNLDLKEIKLINPVFREEQGQIWLDRV